MSKALPGKRITFLPTDGVEQSELEQPWQTLTEAGTDLDLVSLEPGRIRAVKHKDPGDRFAVDVVVSDADVSA